MVVLLVSFMDYVGVALVVPNLIFRWKEIGISPEKLGMVSSIYSTSQLVGGMLIARLGDRGLGRKRTLLLSFAGAAVSYAMVGVATTIETLALSRVLVGLVKQTQTCSTALITAWSDDTDRAQALGRLSSASTLALLSGQAAGGYLSSAYGRRAPCFVASSLFVFAFLVTLLVLPLDTGAAKEEAKEETKAGAARGVAEDKMQPVREGTRLGRFVSTFASAVNSKAARRVLGFRLAYGFAMRSIYSLHSLYEKERWELTPATAGYLSSYKQAMGLAVNALLLGALTRRLTEPTLVAVVLAVSAANAALESSHASFGLYVALNLPLSSVSGALMRTTLSSLFSKAVPVRDAASALSVLDVFNSAIGILAPLYGGVVLGRLGIESQPAVSVAHYLALLFLVLAGGLGDGLGTTAAASAKTKQA
jgi:predicted MFS family arabinose efflux permease